MSNIVNDFTLITMIVAAVFYSGFPMEIESIINRAMKKSGHIGTFVLPKPFSCSLCMTFWTCLIWGLCIYGFSLTNVLLALVAGLSASVAENLYSLVFDTINTFIIRINEYLNS